MDHRFTRRPIASWYIIAAIASLLFMGLGLIAFLLHVVTDPANLPLDQRAQFEAEPAWIVAIAGLAFAAGALGGLLLVLRRKAAQPLMLVALAGLIIWAAGIFAMPRYRDLLSTNQIALVIVVLALAWTIFWFARHSRQRGWLR
jgi:hypothetical protein